MSPDWINWFKYIGKNPTAFQKLISSNECNLFKFYMALKYYYNNPFHGEIEQMINGTYTQDENTPALDTPSNFLKDIIYNVNLQVGIKENNSGSQEEQEEDVFVDPLEASKNKPMSNRDKEVMLGLNTQQEENDKTDILQDLNDVNELRKETMASIKKSRADVKEKGFFKSLGESMGDEKLFTQSLKDLRKERAQQKLASSD